jgi:hypothetical protein
LHRRIKLTPILHVLCSVICVSHKFLFNVAAFTIFLISTATNTINKESKDNIVVKNLIERTDNHVETIECEHISLQLISFIYIWI